MPRITLIYPRPTSGEVAIPSSQLQPLGPGPLDPSKNIIYFENQNELADENTGGVNKELARQVCKMKEVSDLYAMFSESRILDNMCGQGVLSSQLMATRWGDDMTWPRINAVDEKLDPTGVAQADVPFLGAAPGQHPPMPLGCARMPKDKLNFDDNTFDCIITMASYQYFLVDQANMKEVYRTLKPGGVAIFAHASCLAYVNGLETPALGENQTPLRSLGMKLDHIVALINHGTGHKFTDFRGHPHTVHIGAANRNYLRVLLLSKFKPLWKCWCPASRERFNKGVDSLMSDFGEDYMGPAGVAGFGIRMKGTVVICRKPVPTVETRPSRLVLKPFRQL